VINLTQLYLLKFNFLLLYIMNSVFTHTRSYNMKL